MMIAILPKDTVSRAIGYVREKSAILLAFLMRVNRDRNAWGGDRTAAQERSAANATAPLSEAGRRGQGGSRA